MGLRTRGFCSCNSDLAKLYSRTGQFPLAWKTFEFSLKNAAAHMDIQSANHASFALSLAQGGNPARAVEEGIDQCAYEP